MILLATVRIGVLLTVFITALADKRGRKKLLEFHYMEGVSSSFECCGSKSLDLGPYTIICSRLRYFYQHLNRNYGS